MKQWLVSGIRALADSVKRIAMSKQDKQALASMRRTQDEDAETLEAVLRRLGWMQQEQKD